MTVERMVLHIGKPIPTKGNIMNDTITKPEIRRNHPVTIGFDDEVFVAARVDLRQRWNGFLAAPMFTLDEARKVIAWVNDPEAYGGSTMTYDEATDAIVFVDENYSDEEDYEPSRWAGFDVDGEHFYTIGDGWTWSSYYPENVAAVVEHAPIGALIAGDVTDEAPYFLTVEPVGDKFAGWIWEHSVAAGKFIGTATGARFDTDAEARAWTRTFTASADGPLGARSVTVYEV